MYRIRLVNSAFLGWALLSALVCSSIAGCGFRPTRVEVSGVVRCDGKPLPFGNIQFLGPDGVPCASAIKADGTFSARVTAGEVKVIVTCIDEKRLNERTAEMMNKEGRSAPPPATENFSLIPKRYADWESSGLTIRVERGMPVQELSLASR